MIKRSTIAAAIAATSVGLGIFAVSTPAKASTPAPTAAITNVEEVPSPFEPAAIQTSNIVTATCPGAKVVVGSGFQIAGSGVVATDLDITEKTVQLRARVDNSPAVGSWTSTAVAYCADRPAGYLIPPKAKTTESPAPEKVVKATCPSSKQVIGTGFGTFNGNGRVYMDEVIPSKSQVSVKAFDRQPGQPWILEAYAICADVIPGSTVAVTDPVGFNSVAKDGEADCPGATKAINASFDLIGSLGQANPILARRKVNQPFRTQTAAFEDFDGTSKNWAIVSYAICA